MNLKQELEERGFLYQFSDEKLFEVYEKGNEALYCGTDPTADSLHIGHLIPVMAAVNFMKKGNKFYFLVGGATGMIGDPGGRESERTFLNEETLENNQKAIYNQLSNLFKNLEKASGIKFEFEVINNIDFYKNMSILEFLRDCGKYITVNSMMNKETVKKRIEDPDKSISYTEFSYMLLQGFDFYKLYSGKNIKLQIGGSDQWGNLVTGVEIIRKKIDKQGFVMTLPLVTDANGKKFGKSEGNAIWIDKNKSTPYFIYQYFMNTSDEDVEKFLKLLTLMSFDEISDIVRIHNEKPELRYGQKALAYNIIQTIHGQEDANQAEKISEILFGNSDKIELLKSMSDNEIDALEKETGGAIFKEELLETLIDCGLFTSKGEARKMVQSGGVYLNEEKVTDPSYVLGGKDLINGKYALIRKGKKSYKLIRKN